MRVLPPQGAGSSTRAAPWARSRWCCTRTRSRWRTSAGRTTSGSDVTRSFAPLARHSRNSPRSRSTSFTRSVKASSNRSPPPYSSNATSFDTPSIRARTPATSTRDNTTGSRVGRRPVGIASSPSSGSFSTARHPPFRRQMGQERPDLGGAVPGAGRRVKLRSLQNTIRASRL